MIHGTGCPRKNGVKIFISNEKLSLQVFNPISRSFQMILTAFFSGTPCTSSIKYLVHMTFCINCNKQVEKKIFEVKHICPQVIKIDWNLLLNYFPTRAQWKWRLRASLCNPRNAPWNTVSLVIGDFNSPLLCATDFLLNFSLVTQLTQIIKAVKVKNIIFKVLIVNEEKAHK